jgi:hypothetical protein
MPRAVQSARAEMTKGELMMNVDKIDAASVEESSNWGKREEGETRGKKRFPVDVVWTEVPPDDYRELKGTLTRDERKESQNDRINV